MLYNKAINNLFWGAVSNHSIHMQYVRQNNLNTVLAWDLYILYVTCKWTWLVGFGEKLCVKKAYIIALVTVKVI